MRQVTKRSASSSGAVATSAPAPPAAMIQPASEACRSGGYQVAIAFIGAIRQTATPSPISARAPSSAASLPANANASAPDAAITSSTGSTRRGP